MPGTLLDADLAAWRACWSAPHVAVVAGPDAGWLLPLPAHGSLVVGRSARADLPLADPALRERHLVLRPRGGHWRLTRARGVQVRVVRGRRRPRPVPLAGRSVRPGDALLIGGTRLELRSAGAAQDGPADLTLPADRAASGPPPPVRWRRALGVLPLLLLAFTLTRTLSIPWWVLAAIAAAAAAGFGIARLARGRPDRSPAGPREVDPATFALWCAHTGEPPARSRPILGSIAVSGPDAAGLARWLRISQPSRGVSCVRAADEVPQGSEHRTSDGTGVSPAWEQRILRAISAPAEQTDMLRLLGLAEHPEPAAGIARRWLARTDAGGGMSVPLGVVAGETLTLDLVEHGPHALIAGTTGSGKSELLLAWVLALAARFSPAEVTFLLVDFKGGATFSRVADLPHCAGLVGDLDAGTSARALAALRHELRRRERLLAEAGVATLEQFVAAGGVLARLVVVVDELRALVAEDPERLADLVQVATLGRSLGVHLILATQRPGGVVSGQLRSNLAVRICLRVTDPADAVDLLGHPGAAERLPAGRGFIAGGPISADVGVRFAWLPGSATLAADITAAADRVRLARRAELLAVTKPWLPALPDRASRREHHGVLLLDRHDPPRHEPWRWSGGTLLVTGPPGRGRSTALRAAAGEAARRGRVVHVVSDREWGVPDGAGTTVAAADVPRLVRFLNLLAQGADPEAAVVLDGAETIVSAVDSVLRPGSGTDLLTRLVQQRRTGWLALSAQQAHRWTSYAEHHLVLAGDPSLAALAGVPRRLIDPTAGPGRGVLVHRGEAVTAQVIVDDALLPPAAGIQASLRLMPLPERVLRSALPPASGHVGTRRGNLRLPLGLGGDRAAPVWAELCMGKPWLVVGPPGSGRTTALHTIAAGLADLGLTVREPGEGGQRDESGVWLVDDAEELEPPAAESLLPALAGRCVIATTPAAATTSLRGLLGAARTAKTVLALGGYNPGPPDPLALPGLGPPGRALLLRDGRGIAVQLALP